jgi:hypothetical protein
MQALLLSLSLALSAPAPQDASGAPEVVADDGKSIFGAPLYVNGRRVTDNEIKLWIIYGPCRAMLESYRIHLIIDEELKRRAEEFADARIAEIEKEKPFASPDERRKFRTAEIQRQYAGFKQEFVATDEDVEKEYDRTVSDFKKKYPILDSETEISRAYRSPEGYRFQLRQTILFDRVFLPPNPDEWPIVTLEAVRADSGQTLVDDAKQSYEMRKKWQEEHGGDFPPEDSIYATMMRQIVRDAMFGLIDFKTSFAGLKDGVALTADVNGDGTPEQVVTTDEIWKRIEAGVSPQEIEDAKSYWIAFYATQDRLKKDGHLPTPEQRQKVLQAKMKLLEGTYLNLDILAQHTQYFPSTETFLEYECLMEGFKEIMKPHTEPGPAGELNPSLRAHYDKAIKIMGLGQVEPEVMLISAFDIPNFKWKPDGWNWARKKADEIVARVKANDEEYAKQKREAAAAAEQGKEYKPEKPAQEPYRFWTDMMNDHSEWWDPPQPQQGKPGSEYSMKKKGRFGLRYRHDLEGAMGENKYKHWVNGFSITDYVFFEQAENTVAGPFKSNQGYYVIRLNKRTPPSRSLNLSDPRHIDLLRDDLLKYELVKYTADAVKQSEIKGR